MRAVTWQGNHDVSVETVPEPKIEHPTDAIVRITSSGISGSDLHLYEVLGAFIDPGDILGHEPMGIVEEVGLEVKNVAAGDRVVIPFNISCGHCYTCDKNLQSQCETTQVHEYGTGAALLGYTKLYGQVPGGQAEYLRVPQARSGSMISPRITCRSSKHPMPTRSSRKGRRRIQDPAPAVAPNHPTFGRNRPSSAST